MSVTGPATVFNAYLDAFTSGDLDAAYALIADDFVFEGPMLQSVGKAAFVEGSRGLQPIARGHTLLRQFEDGDEVFSLYDFDVETPAGSGSVTMAEWNVVRDGRLASARLVFDTAAFAALMPQS
ncbi:MAG TPA: nuclear transport factor 2 family protein [Acidimicrobiia bacterium]